MKNTVIVFLLAMLCGMSAMAQSDSTLFDNIYAGFQISGNITADGFDTWQTTEEGNLRLGIEKNITLPGKWGEIYLLGCYNKTPDNSFTFIKWHKQLNSFIKLNIGNMPTVMPFFTRPNPVGPDAHFENLALAKEIPGQKLGVNFDFLVDDAGSQIFLGSFYNQDYWMELNIGAKMVGSDFDLRVAGMFYGFQKHDTLLGIPKEFHGLTNNHIAMGGVAQLNYGKFNLTIFGKQDETGDNTFSGYAEIDINGYKPNIGCIIYENQNNLPNKEDYLEFGVYKKLNQKLNFMGPNVHLLGSVGYQHLPFEAITFAIQAYIQ